MKNIIAITLIFAVAVTGCQEIKLKTFVVKAGELGPSFELSLPTGWKSRDAANNSTTVDSGIFVNESTGARLDVTVISAPPADNEARSALKAALQPLEQSQAFTGVNANGLAGGYRRRTDKPGGPFDSIDGVFLGESVGVFVHLESKQKLSEAEVAVVKKVIESFRVRTSK